MLFYQPTSHHTHFTQTDPSVEKGARFLNELETEAEKRILKTLLVGTDEFKTQFVLFEQARNISTMSTETYVAFTVNGRQFKSRISTSEPWGAGKDEAAMEVFHQLATTIASQLMTELFERQLWHSR